MYWKSYIYLYEAKEHNVIAKLLFFIKNSFELVEKIQVFRNSFKTSLKIYKYYHQAF